MITVIQDTEIVPETGSVSGKTVLFEILQQGPVSAAIFIRNAGANQINYIFQEFNGTTWVDLGVLGTDFNNSLAVGSLGTKLFKLTSVYARVRVIASATGGSTLDFTLTRYVVRTSFGGVPILSF
jgi:hypothetical protein